MQLYVHFAAVSLICVDTTIPVDTVSVKLTLQLTDNITDTVTGTSVCMFLFLLKVRN